MGKNKNTNEEYLYLCPKDGYVLFYDSQLLSGNLGKASLGTGNKGLMLSLIRDSNPYIAAEIMHRFTKLSSCWLSNYGLSMSASDVAPS